MSFTRQSAEHVFPFEFDRVFDALVLAIPRCGFSLKDLNKQIGRVTASSGMSAFSYGENIAFSVYKVNEYSTALSISSALKVGVNIGGAHRHQKNFDSILRAMGFELGQPDTLRKWVDSSGEHSVMARFVGLVGETVRLQRQRDGSVIEVPREAMCKDDCAWVTDFLRNTK